jgi:FkbM family methyltransferase
MIRWLTQRLKSCYPFSEIARVIDLDRSEMVAHADAIRRVEAAVRQLGQNQSEIHGQLCSLVTNVGGQVERAANELGTRHTANELAILGALNAAGDDLRESVTALGAAHRADRSELSQAVNLVAQLVSSTVENRKNFGVTLERFEERIKQTSESNAEVSTRLSIACEGIRAATGDIDRRQTELHGLLLERLDQLEACDAKEASRVEANLATIIGEQHQRISSVVRGEHERTRALNGEIWREDVKPSIDEANAAIAMATAAIEETQPAIDELKPAIDEASAAIEDANASFTARIDDNLAACRAGQWARTTGDERTDPEVCLLEYLAPFVRNRVAIDIGANEGLLSLRLARAGYRVTAFEPNPALSQTLETRSAEAPGFTLRREAIGAADGQMELNLVEDRSGSDKYRGRLSLYSSLTTHSLTDDLAFSGGVSVPVRSIDSLRKAREIPSTVGVLKIDTEGYDLEVVRGMGTLKSHIVVAEFWDKEMAFGRGGLLYHLPDLVDAMQARGYYHYIILHRDAEGSENVSFYTNQPESVAGSWGNAMFFGSYELFEKAVGWCSSRFPRTVFHCGRDQVSSGNGTGA